VKVRFSADADFDRRIAHATLRREVSIDLQLAAVARDEAGLRGVPDDQVLAEAAREGRILLSHDHRIIPRHFATVITLQHSPGVIIMPQRMGIRLAMEWIVTIWGVQVKPRSRSIRSSFFRVKGSQKNVRLHALRSDQG
jgi:hypothetical protein